MADGISISRAIRSKEKLCCGHRMIVARDGAGGRHVIPIKSIVRIEAPARGEVLWIHLSDGKAVVVEFPTEQQAEDALQELATAVYGVTATR